MRRHSFPDGIGHFFNGSPSVDETEPSRMLFSKPEITAPDAVVKGEALLVDTGFGGVAALVAPPRSLQAGIEVDIDQEGQVGDKAVTCDAIEIQNHLRIQPAAATLVHQRRVGEPVTDHILAAGKCGTYYLLHILGAASEVQEQFGTRVNRLVRGIEQDAPDLPSDIGAAGLGGLDHSAPTVAKRLRKKPDLRGLTASIQTFKSNEQPCRHQKIRFSQKGPLVLVDLSL